MTTDELIEQHIHGLRGKSRTIARQSFIAGMQAASLLIRDRCSEFDSIKSPIVRVPIKRPDVALRNRRTAKILFFVGNNQHV